MKDLNEKDLHQRLKDVMTNLFTLTGKGQLSPIIDLNNSNIMRECKYWTSRFAHILEEYALRGSDFVPPSPEEMLLPRLTWPNAPKAAEAIKGKEIFDGYLFKYGEYKHIHDIYEFGHILIRPASFYNDPSINFSIRDDELSLKTASTEYKSTFDYYLYCVSKIYDYRLFDVFQDKNNYDCCLIIKEPNIFSTKLRTKFLEEMPDWNMSAQEVSYIDPLLPPSKVDLFFSKHFRFSFNKEFRVVWLPSTNDAKQIALKKQLKNVELIVSNLKDCCDLIKL